jgi:hypothetical protein
LAVNNRAAFVPATRQAAWVWLRTIAYAQLELLWVYTADILLFIRLANIPAKGKVGEQLITTSLGWKGQADFGAARFATPDM